MRAQLVWKRSRIWHTLRMNWLMKSFESRATSSKRLVLFRLSDVFSHHCSRGRAGGACVSSFSVSRAWTRRDDVSFIVTVYRRFKLKACGLLVYSLNTYLPRYMHANEMRAYRVTISSSEVYLHIISEIMLVTLAPRLPPLSYNGRDAVVFLCYDIIYRSI